MGALEDCRHTGFSEMAGESSAFEGGRVPWQTGLLKPCHCELSRRGKWTARKLEGPGSAKATGSLPVVFCGSPTMLSNSQGSQDCNR